jgi:hypothetical protein
MGLSKALCIDRNSESAENAFIGGKAGTEYTYYGTGIGVLLA